MTEDVELQHDIIRSTGAEIQVRTDLAAFEQNLATYVNSLITGDFSKLVFILYRLDISEKKLKEILAAQHQTDAGLIIARMIIDRQQQKILLRKQYRQDAADISEDEKW